MAWDFFRNLYREDIPTGRTRYLTSMVPRILTSDLTNLASIVTIDKFARLYLI